MALRRDSQATGDAAILAELTALRAELADLRAAHTAQVQQIRDEQVALIHAIRDEQVALLQDLHNRRTVQTDAVLERVESSHATLLSAAQAIADDEPRARAALAALRASDQYEAAWTDPNPLVSIVIPSYTNFEGLRDRSVPSALAQTHANVEVIVVGDAAPAETAEVMASFSDARVHYENLTMRGPYPDDKIERWHVAGTYPLNRAIALARGQWLAVLNDDDAFRPDFIERLLAHARATHAEVAYGQLVTHSPDGPPEVVAAFPPRSHGFAWQMAVHHAGLRIFDYEVYASTFGEPGDWNRARRMMRAGVRFSLLEEVVSDYYPSTLWKSER